ncbi:type II secretory pathway component PulF [Deinococcus soli (ex Cha et al. 2016)]|uniref:Type II secretory pathway component PulF n=1 Tax=Deinococcus soli (ex Cha et al. 2016) TaxID=1309411 RepID=A0AAE3XEP9_9DEIO|nr:hypothetical protein [Deinococcus soli (ex Cha et al. 2016)]MDR6219971.1 type II secretory pathway component PulF [Deinococcus soli (ex Cha et al. 2016)]
MSHVAATDESGTSATRLANELATWQLKIKAEVKRALIRALLVVITSCLAALFMVVSVLPPFIHLLPDLVP